MPPTIDAIPQALPAVVQSAQRGMRIAIAAAGVRAWYVRVGGEAVTPLPEVAVHLSSRSPSYEQPSVPMRVPGATSTAQLFEVAVVAAVAGETDLGKGVTASGGVETLKHGDRFIVPGWAAKRPLQATAIVIVQGETRLVDGVVWHGQGVVA